MRALVLLSLLVSCGPGKTDAEKATEACLTACDSYAQYMTTCGLSLGTTPQAFCESECSGVDATLDAGCGDAYDLVIECKTGLNWAATDCDADAITDLQLNACAEAEADLAECL